jgi:hypothetical protein
MSSNVSRKLAAALLFATLVSLTAPPAAQAWSARARRSFDGPVRDLPERGFFSYLLRLFVDAAGGAMDPNGNS